jgi:hypothetical protein
MRKGEAGCMRLWRMKKYNEGEGMGRCCQARCFSHFGVEGSLEEEELCVGWGDDLLMEGNLEGVGIGECCCRGRYHC